MRRVRAGELIAGASALVLLAALFLDWYTATAFFGAMDVALNAWEAFTIVDLLLALVVALGLAVLISQVAGRGPALPVALAVITTSFALLMTLLVLYRIANQPGPNASLDVSLGAWLGLAGTAGVFFGAWRSLDDERARPADPPAPEPERRPTPRIGVDEPQP